MKLKMIFISNYSWLNKGALFFVSFCLFTINLSSQNVLNPDWIQQVFSVENGNAGAWDLDVDDDGMIYWPVTIDSLMGGIDAYCYKFDKNGISQWENPFHYKKFGAQNAFSVNAKSDFLYVGGRECLITGFDCDMLLFKIDKANGTLVWDRLQDFGNNGYDEIDGLVVKEDGIYCGGWAQVIQTGPYQTEIGLWKLDFEGNTEWVNHFGKAGTAEHQDGHFVVDDDYIYTGGLFGGKGLANLNNGFSHVGKFSKEDGSLIDTTLFGPQSDALLDAENVLGMATDGEYLYVTGYTTPVSAFQWETFVAKFDKDLNQIWLKNWGGTGAESSRGITVHDGKIYVAGLTESPEYSPGGNADALLLIFDTDGNFISHHTWGDELSNSFRDVVVKDGAIYLSGTSGDGGFSQDESVSGNLLKVSLDKLTSVDSYDEAFNELVKIYPNPSSSIINVELNNLKYKNLDLLIYDINGKLKHKSKLDQRISTFNFDLAAGVYFYKIKTSNKIQTNGKIILF